MGGNGPLVVMDDADVDAAVEAALTACYLCAGQSCTAGERMLVAEARARRVRREARQRRDRARSCSATRSTTATTMGPVNNERVAAKMDEHVADAVDAGRRWSPAARAGGFPTDLYWPATILDGVAEDAEVAREETFGPVAPVVAIRGLEQAIELANASPYGLLAAIFTADLMRGLQFAERVRTGLVNINESTELLGEPPPVRRPRGHRQRRRPRRRASRHAGVHRAADGRHRLTVARPRAVVRGRLRRRAARASEGEGLSRGAWAGTRVGLVGGENASAHRRRRRARALLHPVWQQAEVQAPEAVGRELGLDRVVGHEHREVALVGAATSRRRACPAEPLVRIMRLTAS